MKNLRSVIVLVALFCIYWFFIRTDYGDKLEFNATEVYYTEEVSEDEAQKLGEYLVSSEFADGQKKSVQLSKRDSTYLFRMVVKEGAEKDSANDIAFEAMAMMISWQVFDHQPLELHACDNTFETLRTYESW